METKVNCTRPTFYTVNEVAEILKVKPNVVYRAIASGKLRSVRIGRRLRVPAQALEELGSQRSSGV